MLTRDGLQDGRYFDQTDGCCVDYNGVLNVDYMYGDWERALRRLDQGNGRYVDQRTGVTLTRKTGVTLLRELDIMLYRGGRYGD